MKIHHLGWLVKDIEKSVNAFKALMGGDLSVEEPVVDTDRLIKLVFVHSDILCFEFIEPVSKESPVYEILKREGASLYHICMEVEDIDMETDRMVKKGILLVHPKKPAVAIGNRNVAFLYDKNLGLVELVETDSDR